MEDNYKAHDAYAKAYTNSLDKEKDLFQYIVDTKGKAEQSKIDEKTKAIDNSYKDVNKKIKDYSKHVTNAVNKWKRLNKLNKQH